MTNLDNARHAFADLIAECQRANANPNSHGVDADTLDRAADALRRIEPTEYEPDGYDPAEPVPTVNDPTGPF